MDAQAPSYHDVGAFCCLAFCAMAAVRGTSSDVPGFPRMPRSANPRTAATLVFSRSSRSSFAFLEKQHEQLPPAPTRAGIGLKGCVN